MSNLASMMCVLYCTLGFVLPSQSEEPVVWLEDTFAIWTVPNAAIEQTAVVSWSDWLVFQNATYDRPGVRRILNQMSAAGIRTVWWRTFGGGWALYPSKVDGVTTGNYSGQGADYSSFDSLKEAVIYGHELGLEVYAWYTPLEEAHGWSDNVRSKYTDEHSDLWDMSNIGVATGAPSFAYEQYRKYKVALATEMVNEYEVDGLVLDFERPGTPPRNDTWGYLPSITEAFHNETKLDPHELSSQDSRWQKFRAAYVGEFIEDVSVAIDSLDRDVDFKIMFPAAKPLTAHWDIEAWSRKQIIDGIVPVAHGQEGWASPAEGFDQILNKYQYLDLPVSWILYTLKTNREQLNQRVNLALRDGCEDLVWFETTYLHSKELYDVPCRIGNPRVAEVESPVVNTAEGGELIILAAGDWSLRINESEIATGLANTVSTVVLPPYKGRNRINLSCHLNEKSQYAGIVVQGVVGGKQITSNSSWRSSSSSSPAVVTVARPGVPPFLGEKP